MNLSNRHLLLVICAPLAVAGCAAGPSSTVPIEHKPILVQLDDRYWVDLTDVQEIAFVPTGEIRVWHRGSADPFDFSFDDRPAAVRAWKKLVTQLGGTLNEPDLKIAAAPQAVEPKSAAKETPAPATEDDGPYTHLRQDLTALAACRDEKLLNDVEYENAHQHAVSDFIKIAGNGNGYHCVYTRLHAELAELQATRKDHLLDENAVAAMHAAILARYNIASE